MTLLFILAIVLLAVVSLFGYQMFLQMGRVCLRLDAIERELKNKGILPDPSLRGLPLGAVLAEFVLPVLSGGEMRLSQWRGGRTLLIFIHPRCAFSQELMQKLALRSGESRGLSPLILSTGDVAENQRFFDGIRFPYPVLLQEAEEVASMYNVHGTPAGYLVDEVGRTASDLVIGVEPLLNLIHAPGREEKSVVARGAVGRFSRAVMDSRIVRHGLKSGARAPAFLLPKLNGGELKLEDFKDRKVLLVFSDPACAPCVRLAAELEKLHRKWNGLHLVMISRGDPEANRRNALELDLTFPIGLQRRWEISESYGILATPIAYLIDQNGMLESDVAAGGEAILELAGCAAEHL